MFGWGGGLEPVRLEKKSALNFFGPGSRSSPAAGAARAPRARRAMANRPMRPEAETSGRGRDPQFDLES